MSQENVEMVERAYSGGGDIVAGVIEAMHPEVELLGAIGGMEEGTTTVGRGAVAQALSVDSEIWAERRLELRRAIDAGDQVVALVHEYRTGKGSGVAVSEPVFQLFKLRRGLVVQQEDFLDRSEALEAAGLRE